MVYLMVHGSVVFEFKGLPGNKIILSEKRSSSLGSTKTTPHRRASAGDSSSRFAALEYAQLMASAAEDERARRERLTALRLLNGW